MRSIIQERDISRLITKCTTVIDINAIHVGFVFSISGIPCSINISNDEVIIYMGFILINSDGFVGVSALQRSRIVVLK